MIYAVVETLDYLVDDW